MGGGPALLLVIDGTQAEFGLGRAEHGLEFMKRMQQEMQLLIRSPSALFEAVNGISRQGDHDGDGRVLSECRHRLEVARYPAEGVCEHECLEAT